MLRVSVRSAKPNRASICALLLTSNSFLTSLAPPQKRCWLYVNWGWAICRDKSLSLHKNPLTDQECRSNAKLTFRCLFGNSLHQKHSAVKLHTLQMQGMLCKGAEKRHWEVHSPFLSPSHREFARILISLTKDYSFSPFAVSLQRLSPKHSCCTIRLLRESKTQGPALWSGGRVRLYRKGHKATAAVNPYLRWGLYIATFVNEQGGWSFRLATATIKREKSCPINQKRARARFERCSILTWDGRISDIYSQGASVFFQACP